MVGTGVWFAMRPTPPRVSRLQITPPTAEALAIYGATRALAITPDGSRVIYTGVNNTLIVRALDQLNATTLAGLGNSPGAPFVSPDGQWIGFAADGNRNLTKVANGLLGTTYYKPGDKGKARACTLTAKDYCERIGDQEGVKMYTDNLRIIDTG
jgi:hypothetical protein